MDKHLKSPRGELFRNSLCTDLPRRKLLLGYLGIDFLEPLIIPDRLAEYVTMNIKGLMSGPLPTQIKPVEKIERTVKSDITHDRDSNGRQEYSQTKDETPQRAMTEDEIKRALEFLSQLKVVKEHNWSVVLDTDGGKRFVLIKDNLGTVIRRIPERELWSLKYDDNSGRSGQILRKIA